ncbi:rod shape-determining protein MreC [bacterium]|nr:rod shape-determining protein MreC [bacterium]
MPSLSRSIRQPRQAALTGVALILFAVVLITAQGRFDAELDGTRGLVATLLVPIVEAGAKVNHEAEQIWLGFFGTTSIIEENARLREELARLQVEQAAARTEAAALSQAVVLGGELPKFAPSSQSAQVLASVPDGRRRSLWIDRGWNEGIGEGQVVLGPHGVLGTIQEAHPHHAIVQLLTDEQSRWGGEVTNRGEAGVVHGTGRSDALEFQLELTTTEIEPGDVVITSGKRGSAVPAGLPLGRVREVTLDKSGERHAVLEPTDPAEELRTVFILDAEQIPWEPSR